MLNAKLLRGYWSEGQVLRIGWVFSATLWTQLSICGMWQLIQTTVEDVFAPSLQKAPPGARVGKILRDPCGKNKKGPDQVGAQFQSALNFCSAPALLLVFVRLLSRWRSRRRRRRRRRLRNSGH